MAPVQNYGMHIEHEADHTETFTMIVISCTVCCEHGHMQYPSTLPAAKGISPFGNFISLRRFPLGLQQADTYSAPDKLKTLQVFSSKMPRQAHYRPEHATGRLRTVVHTSEFEQTCNADISTIVGGLLSVCSAARDFRRPWAASDSRLLGTGPFGPDPDRYTPCQVTEQSAAAHSLLR